MTFASIANGTAVFVDANIFVYSFGPDPQLGVPRAKRSTVTIQRHVGLSSNA
jgi:hypothetical protein